MSSYNMTTTASGLAGAPDLALRSRTGTPPGARASRQTMQLSRQPRRPRFELNDKVALITGAGSGIGRAVALQAARRGCHLALLDRDADGLALTKTLAASGSRISLHPCDVTDRGAVSALPAEVEAQHGRLDLLMNNAGVALGGSFAMVSEADFDWLMEINFNAVVRLTRACLPLLLARPESRLVNVSSIFGIVAPPGQAAYAASKFAVRGFTEALRHELQGGPVGVTVVYPGGVRTSIAKNARTPGGPDVSPAEVERQRKAFQRNLKLSAERAAEIIVDGVERRRTRILVGADAQGADVLQRLLPRSYWRVLSRYVR